jgi:hypothetical protein
LFETSYRNGSTHDLLPEGSPWLHVRTSHCTASNTKYCGIAERYQGNGITKIQRVTVMPFRSSDRTLGQNRRKDKTSARAAHHCLSTFDPARIVMHGSGSGRTGKPTQGTILASHPTLATGCCPKAADTGGQPHMLMEELGVLIGAGSGTPSVPDPGS